MTSIYEMVFALSTLIHFLYYKKLELYDSKELKEWVDDKGKMHTARKVSEYAMHGPGEFIAETYDKLVRKSNLDDDVLELYKFSKFRFDFFKCF